ncbi:MAG: symmetrical bis(5'-nucleosyl)-tetraphosphatase [Gammaproteobacteria bacterium]|nr:symmetrical bis(5'-nucleosyl)-tetraphosphatase [Gammaproteobacteria bacterium]
MATWAIGDLQGCHAPLMRLIDRIDFDPAKHRLWLVGDLVNRGPDSLEVLRWVRAQGDAVCTVLGNHDLHLLARASTRTTLRARDTLDAVLQASDADELIDWLRHRPLASFDASLDALLVHAGIPPGWDVETTLGEARRVEEVLRGSDWRDLMAVLYGDKPDRWSPALSGYNRLRFTINALTRMRFCRRDGSLDMKAKGPPGSQTPGLVPWFEHPQAAWGATRVVVGHWSALGCTRRANLVTLDTGCYWGRSLTALRLDQADAQPVSEPCRKGGL